MKRERSARQNEAAREAFGASSGLGIARRRLWPSRGRRSLLISTPSVIAALAVVILFDGVEDGQLHLFSLHPTCIAAGVDSADGNEGTCMEGPLTSPTTVNVVDRARTLHMPEYDARLLVSLIKPTRVSNASEHRYYYTNGAGQLASYKLSITNTGTRPLKFGLGVGYERRASYSPNPEVELALPELSDRTGDTTTSYPPIIEGRGAPTPSILQQPPIAPKETRTGWVSFVAPAWALGAIARPGADIDFYKVDGSTSYRGSIRLWK
jgi:hypothetical protein